MGLGLTERDAFVDTVLMGLGLTERDAGISVPSL